MPAHTFSIHEKTEVEKYFGVPLDELDKSTFEEALRKLRAKYHPDNFEHMENEAVREMATEKFQAIEALSAKIKTYMGEASPKTSLQNTGRQDFMPSDAVFAGRRPKMEILTSDKDLKYHLFGTRYRWLQFGDSFRIPETGASTHTDEGHRGHRVGFRESIRMYLTFGETDAVVDIVSWLFPRNLPPPEIAGQREIAPQCPKLSDICPDQKNTSYGCRKKDRPQKEIIPEKQIQQSPIPELV